MSDRKALFLLFIAILTIFGGAVYLSHCTQIVLVPEGSCNVCIGIKAGYEITTESLQFRFTIPDLIDTIVGVGDDGYSYRTKKTIAGYYEYSADMTPQEYEVVSNLVRRASQQYTYISENSK